MPSPAPATRVTLRPAGPGDADALAALYTHYILHSVVTFEEAPVDAAEMGRRMAAVEAAALPWLVAEDAAGLAGWAYATPWRPRSAYRFSAEVTVYVAPDRQRRGIGAALYGELFPLLAARGIHAALGGIVLPNAASVALHERFGMRQVAHLPQVGFKFGRWLDVGYWQLLLPDATAPR